MERGRKKVGSKTETAAADSGDQSPVTGKRPFLFLHIGDLHITDLPPGAQPPLADRETRLQTDIAAIIADIVSINPQTSYDFIYLPGDLAENACRAEYNILLGLIPKSLKPKIKVIPGDHDRAQGDMRPFDAFRTAVGAPPSQPNQKIEKPFNRCPAPLNIQTKRVNQYYFEETINGVRCLFLDLVSAGQTRKVWGLDFRLGIEQFDWLAKRVEDARHAKPPVPCAVFMHCYPHDMREPDDRRATAGLFWDGGVRLVEMGHTHYNEIGHDGRTMYATARSVGQNEDGPVGYAVGCIDDKVTSWRFKQLQKTWPFVLITSPADHRLASAALSRDSHDMITVRAVVLSDRTPKKVECRVDDGQWRKMKLIGANLYEIAVEWRNGSRKLAVKATDSRWLEKGFDFIDIDTIQPASIDFKPPLMPKHAGSDKLRVGTWKKKGVRGDRLGPNSGGRKW